MEGWRRCTVTSGQNPKIKELIALQEKSSQRRESGLFVVEGRREIGHCLDAGFRPRTIFFCPEIIGEEDLNGILAKVPRGAGAADCKSAATAGESAGRGGAGGGLQIRRNDLEDERNGLGEGRGGLGEGRNGLGEGRGGAGGGLQIRRNDLEDERNDLGEGRGGAGGGLQIRRNDLEEGRNDLGDEREAMVVEVPGRIYDKVAYRGGTEGIIAVVEAKERRLEDLQLGERPLIAVLEGVEKPGNLGAVLRSADAAGADAVVLCDSPTDLYNPNLIRASIGAVFSRPVAVASSKETINWLKANKIKILTAQLQDSEWYYETEMGGGVAIVMGTEATGLSAEWRAAADAHIKIPMLGQLDSLNVSVSAAILLFEAVRQRHSGDKK